MKKINKEKGERRGEEEGPGWWVKVQVAQLKGNRDQRISAVPGQ